MSNLIAPSKALGYSDIYLDFLARESRAMTFFPAAGVDDVAGRVSSVKFHRREIVDILKAQNRLYGASDKTLENIERLKDDSAVCIFAGQQAGLFGGPLLVMYKALSLVKAARAYQASLGRPVVPVFWIAGDDHDFEEINHTWVLSRSWELSRISYDTSPAIELPAAEIMFTDVSELQKAKNQLREALGTTDFTSEVYDMVEAAYTAKDTFVSSFGKLMASITADTGLVFFSPGDVKAKRLAADLFRNFIEKEDELQARLKETNEAITRSGYHLQVEKSLNASHLFYNLDGRKPVVREGDGYLVGDVRFDREELLACLHDHPERFSPDVMTRPVLQSYLFPVISQNVGAAELAYLAQVHRIFGLFALVTPYYRVRPSLTVVEKQFEKLMDEHDIAFEHLAGDIEQVVNRVLARSFPRDIEESFNEFREHLQRHFQQFSDRSLQYDPGLSALAETTLGKIDFAVKNFESKVFASHKKKSQQTRDRIYRLWHALYPNRNFQERALNVTYFLSKYGRGIIKFLDEKIECEQKSHQLIHLSEFGD